MQPGGRILAAVRSITRFGCSCVQQVMDVYQNTGIGNVPISNRRCNGRRLVFSVSTSFKGGTGVRVTDISRPWRNQLSVFAAGMLLCTAFSAPVMAEEPAPVPERRIALSENLDFYGSDLQTVLDTTYAECEQICLRDRQCKAFTYNTRNGSCFPKSAVGAPQVFEGAISARVFEVDAQVLRSLPGKLERLGFLAPHYLRDAGSYARSLPKDYPSNQHQEQDLLELARQAAVNGNDRRAFELAARAIGIADSATAWMEVANYAMQIQAKDSSRRWQYLQIAASAAVNAFLRAGLPSVEVNALAMLATVLEARNDGRSSIPALRLAQDISPRLENEEALARAVSLFGFRVLEHSVNNNSQSPRICVTFSEPLLDASVDYGDFVRLPEVGLATDVNTDQLCIDGVRHGKRYAFTLREGLPAASGEALIRSVPLNVYVRDRDPAVRFPARAYVLPRSRDAVLPVISVNLDEVDLKIYRVGDRNLLRSIQEDYFTRSLSDYAETTLASSLGQEVWAGIGEVGRILNEDVTTQMPIGDAVSSFEPGVYVLRARVPDADLYSSDAATQWFVVTDLGISTMSGSDGTHVTVRSLATANTVADVKVQLIARDNTVLATGVTDGQGYVHFPPGLSRGEGGARPALITAAVGDDDFVFLDLEEAAFDLSDRGVEGRPAPAPVDVFVTPDRGAYRAGETANVTILARDNQARAIENLPLTALVTRPDGVEFSRQVLKDVGAGGYLLSVNLPVGAQRGTWYLRLYLDPGQPAIASTSFLVEDFVADRIDFDLAMTEGAVRIDALPNIRMDARYLYGAPGSQLPVEGQMTISATRESPAYPGYLFGRADEEFSPVAEYFDAGTTDDEGLLSIVLPSLEVPEYSGLLSLQAYIRATEGSGRPVERSLSRALLPERIRLGLRPQFSGTLDQGERARFDVIAIDADARRIDRSGVQWTLNRVETDYQWYTRYGSWQYEPVIRREAVDSGVIDLTAGQTATIETSVDWGSYELVVRAADDGRVSTSHPFHAGWYGGGEQANSPDVLLVGLDRPEYHVGDTLELRVVSRFSGQAQLAVLNNRLIQQKTVDLVEGENRFDLPVTEDWGAGAYVSATAIRPMDTAAGHNPARGLGLQWAAIHPGKRRLEAFFETADKAEPRGELDASIRIEGLAPGETAYATVAAVDVGVLNITGFEAPSPSGHYFGQQKLGVELRDLYGHLIDALQGSRGRVRSGGDAMAMMRGRAPPTAETLLSLFSGLVTADESGRVPVSFKLPEFDGSVRLMAVVWNKTGIGEATKDVQVVNPIVVTTSQPRFMAPGDRSRLLIEMTHVSGAAGELSVDIDATAEVSLDLSGVSRTISLENQGRATLSIPLQANQPGDAEVAITVATPDGKVLRKQRILSVRDNQSVVSDTRRLTLAPGDSLTLDRTLFTDYRAGSGRASLTLGPLSHFDVAGLLNALDHYPYGCTEQTTSRAMPLLYFDQVIEGMALGERRPVHERVEQAIAAVLLNQASHGGFGLWRPGDGDLWLDAYVSDFLSRARRASFEVPEQGFRLAMDNLRNQVNYAGDFEKGGEALAYALMVLAREGAAAIGDLRYFADVKADAFATPLALAQLATALTYYGEQNRADALFRQAERLFYRQGEQAEKPVWRVDYGSRVRDGAALLALAAESASRAIDRAALIEAVTRNQTVRSSGSTQEQMWSLLAASALLEDAGSDSFTLNGVSLEGPVIELADQEFGDDGSWEIRNTSADSQTLVVSSFGLPVGPLPAGGDGYRIEREYYRLDGERVSPEKVSRNTQLVVLLRVIPQRSGRARLMINDPLPAGFEIDNPAILQAGEVRDLSWLALNASPQHSEFRAERFLSAIDWQGNQVLQVAYRVRAISPGRFFHPAATVEDMYRPEQRARTATGWVEVTE